MSSRHLNILDEDLFPSFIQLPYDNDFDESFYEPDRFSVLNPRHHWCFLAEITHCVPWIRPTYHAKDADGKEILIAFHTEDRSPHIFNQCGVGDTLAIMYANSHSFMDGQAGIRVESDDMVKVLHCNLKGVLNLAKAIFADSGICRACDGKATSKCSRCNMGYCSKRCQIADWKPRHKQECAVAQRIAHWKSFDWQSFDYFRSP